MGITRKLYGQLPDGRDVSAYTLANTNGLSVEIIDFGGIVTSILAPDKSGQYADVVLGFDELDGYLVNKPYFGAIIGRFANRIANASFVLGGVCYDLNRNGGENHLHGGLIGFNKVLWDAAIVSGRSGDQAADTGGTLVLDYISPDGEEHYPGRLNVRVVYELTADNRLKINYRAVSDKDTIVNLTNHSYFNLSGHCAGTIAGHWLLLKASGFTPLSGDYTPTGEIRPVQGTPMDFRQGALIGPGLASGYGQIALMDGYDQNFVLDKNDLSPGMSSLSPQKAAEVHDPASGRVLEVFTTKPGVQLYTGNFLDGSIIGKDGCAYPQRAGMCLETQYFPNSINCASFPSPVLRAGELYQHETIYKFSTR